MSLLGLKPEYVQCPSSVVLSRGDLYALGANTG